MRSAVTGGAGFIGGAVVEALLARGDEVVVVDDLSGGSRDRVPDAAEFVHGDIRDLSVLTAAFEGADVVFHQAALRSVPRSLAEPVLVHEVNATGTLNVLIAAERAGVRRVVYASSSSVYGGASEGPTNEDLPPRPLSPYAVSKLTGEYYCRVWSELGKVSAVALRYFNVFGPGQPADSQYAAVFPSFISLLRADEAPEIHWDGEQSRDFTYIDDVVRANLLAGEAPEASGRVINVAGGEPRTVNAVFEAIARVLGKDIEPRRLPRREGDIRHSHADANRAFELLGWKAESDWETSVASTVAWFAR